MLKSTTLVFSPYPATYAIAKDPKGDVGTDLFHYRVAELKCDFGGIVEATTFKVKLERVKS